MGIKSKIVNEFNKGGILGVLLATIKLPIKRIKSRILSFYLDNSKPVYGLNKTEKRSKKVTVSLTSYPARFPTIHICIKSLLRQSYKPDRIVLYLGDDSPEKAVSQNILQLIPFGLEIKHRPDNLKPHKKYIYAMQEYPDDIIITVDDDMMYGKDLILSLISSYQKYPDAVSARRTHKLLGNGEIHTLWTKEKKPSMQLLAGGGGGVLYPPHCLPSVAFDTELVKKLCLDIDDLWLKVMQIMNNVMIVYVHAKGLKANYIQIQKAQSRDSSESRKYFIETDNGYVPKVDTYIAQIQEHFSINLAEYGLISK